MLELITLDPEFHGLFNLLSMHKILVGDELRVSRLREAIFDVVKEGDVVVDLGTGTGILSFLAVKAGARRVYAIERTDIIELAQKISKANGLDNKIVFCKGEAGKVELPEKADVVISETIGHMALAENFVGNMIDARERFLKPGGVLIPNAVEIYATPVECKEAYDLVSFWNRQHYGIDFSPAVEHAASRPYIYSFTPSELLATPAKLASVNIHTVQSSDIMVDVCFTIEREANLHGFAGWFVASLADNVCMNTSPASEVMHWEQTYFPVNAVQHYKGGDNINVRFGLYSSGSLTRWEWTIAGKSQTDQEAIKSCDGILGIT